MTAFYNQEWFKDAAPYIAAGTVAAGALGGYGASEGWFGDDAANFVNGTAPIEGQGGAWPTGQDLPMPPPDANAYFSDYSQGYGAIPGVQVDTSGTMVNPDVPASAATATGSVNDYTRANFDQRGVQGQTNVPTREATTTGDIKRAAPAAVAQAGQRGVTGQIWDFVKQNPALLLGGLSMGASILGQQMQDKDKTVATPGSPEDMAKRREAELTRWNAIPVTPVQPRRVIPTVAGQGASATGRQRQHFEQYNAGSVVGALPVGMREGGRLRGPGDGMSDSLPAVAHAQTGEQRNIRVADGEYIIPADVVSGIGNGSSDAGVRELDAMLRRVRQERGVKGGQQPKAVDPSRLLPA
jgi:hypothetical protein